MYIIQRRSKQQESLKDFLQNYLSSKVGAPDETSSKANDDMQNYQQLQASELTDYIKDQFEKYAPVEGG